MSAIVMEVTNLQTFNDTVGKKMAMGLDYGQKFIDSFSQMKEMVMGKNKVPIYWDTIP